MDPLKHRVDASSFAFPLGLALMMLLLFLFEAFAADVLIYDRHAIRIGECWRVFSGHFIHRNGYHLALNIAGLILIWNLFGDFLQTHQWLVLTFVIALGQSLGLFVFYPEIAWFEGISGLLHGLIAAGSLISFSRSPAISLSVLVALALKLASEAWFGSSQAIQVWLEQPVLVESHWCGAVVGLLAGAVIVIRRYVR
ncbi:MAG: rhombosortase [Bacterioplanes sp.]|nr:rhombosortase [Bacterioplanes sp.]